MNKKVKAIFFILSAAFCFALMAAFVRLAGDIPSVQKSFFRNLVAFFFAAAVLIREKQPVHIAPRYLPFYFIRAGMGTLGILCNFYAVDHLLLPDASMLNKLSPFFSILLSFIFLKEKVKPLQLLGVLTAFGGALLIIKPGLSSDVFPALIGMLGGFGAGAAYTAVRYLGQHGERGPVIVLFFSGFSCLAVLPVLLFDYTPMSMYQLSMLLLAGLAAAGGQFSITAAYSNAPAREISVYDYTQVIFSALLGFWLFGQIPDLWSVLGYIIICGISVLMFLYNRRAEV